MPGKTKELPFIFVPFFSKQILTKQNMASSKNRQQFLASQISVLMRNKAIKSSSPNHPFFNVCSGGSPYLSYKRDQIINVITDYMDRRVTSPTWGPTPPCKHALILFVIPND